MPEIPWASLSQRLQNEWAPGECITLIGPRGTGKTHMAVTLMDQRRFVLVLATKRKDPLLSDLQRHGYHVTGNLSEISWTTSDRGREPVRPKVVYWPSFPERMDARKRLVAQRAAMARAMDWADKTGGWTVLIDETMWMSETLKLEPELKALWFQGRTQGLSVVACAQRPTHVPRLAFSSADYLFLARTGDKRDIINLREISSGIPPDLIEDSLRQLDATRHEMLFVDCKRDEVARVVAPPR